MKRLHYAVAAGIFALAFGIYVATLAPGVAFIDSGLLTVAAWSGGNAHPPGFPLYLILTKLVTLLPVGTVAWRANLSSAVFAAAACAMVSLATAEALLYAAPAPKKKKRAPEPSPALIPLAMALAGSLMLFARTLWGYATIAEVYALNTFMVSTILWLVLRWRRTVRGRDLYLAALLFGLALGVHHVTVGLTLAGIAAFVLTSAGIRFFRSREFLIAAVVALAGLFMVYSYLPLAAARNPVLNWGDPSSAKSIWQHVTAAQFRMFMSTSAGSSQAGVISSLMGREFGPRGFPAALLLGAAGLIVMLRRDRALFFLIAITITACFAWMMVYPNKNDREASLLPAFVVLAIAAANGAVNTGGRRPVVLAAFLSIPILAAVVHWPYRDRSNWRVPRDYVENALRGIDSDALLITADEQLFTPLFYYQEVEQLRDDVRTLHWDLLMRGWYVDQVERRYPGLFDAVFEELSAYRPYLIALQNDPNAYTDKVFQREIDARFDDFLLALIREQSARGVKVYMTQELAFSRRPVDQSLVRRLAGGYDLVPVGLAVAVLPGHRARTVPMAPIDLRGLAPPSMRYAKDDIVLTDIVPSYRAVLVLRARYLAQTGDLQGAAAEYRQALELGPDAAILQELHIVEARIIR